MIMHILTQELELWRFDDTFVNAPHTHAEWYQITIPIRGTCEMTQENKTYRLTEGSGLIQHPNEEHFFQIGANAGVIIIKVHQSILEQSFGHGLKVELASKQAFDPHEITEQFRGWTSAFLKQGMPEPLQVQETQDRVLQYLKHTIAVNARNSSIALIKRKALDPHIARVLEYMHEHYTSTIDIDTLAAIALQSRFHFIRSFKQMTGWTPYQYVLRLRINEAKQRLKHSRITIASLSARLGFSCASQFYRAFVKLEGVTPEQYRQNIF